MNPRASVRMPALSTCSRSAFDRRPVASMTVSTDTENRAPEARSRVSRRMSLRPLSTRSTSISVSTCIRVRSARRSSAAISGSSPGTRRSAASMSVTAVPIAEKK